MPDAVDLIRFLKTSRKDLSIVFADRKLELNKEVSNEDEHYFYELVITAVREIYQRSEIINLVLKKTRDSGVKFGRPNKSSLDKKRKEIMAMLNRDISKAFIARSLKVNPSTLHRWLKKEEIEILEECGYPIDKYKYDFKTGSISKRR